MGIGAIVGITPMIIKSGELKAIPNPFEESDREQIDFIRDVVLEMQKEFIGLVKEEREISPERINVVSDGRIFTSRQAQKINLIDEIAAEKDAINWIKKKGGLDDFLVSTPNSKLPEKAKKLKKTILSQTN